ncbi:DUF4328 domain-containing protein [Pontibacter pudoricolor]|uniref:DUF4328 domain-containing protein n=1 Tax=Pontibacter pudoricolor TaxID=2694930 RepID=UPI001390EA76|nr:DUF4328 domain-containing protein [Pontibacter pudoricolor]
MTLTKPNGQRAKMAIALIGGVLAAEVLAFYSSYLQYTLLEDAASGIFSEEAMAANDAREQLVAGIYFLLFAGSGLAFVLWFRRAYYNLQQRTGANSFSDGWALGSWFVPILCLYRPYQIMRELYLDTSRMLAAFGQEYALKTTYLGSWWALWIFSNFLGQILFRSYMNSETLEGLTNATVASMFGNLVGIPLALITMKVIKDYARVEKLLWETEQGEGDGMAASGEAGLSGNAFLPVN